MEGWYEWLVIPTGGSPDCWASNQQQSRDGERRLSIFSSHLGPAGSGSRPLCSFCSFALTPNPNPHPTPQQRWRSSEGHKLKLAFAWPLGDPDRIGGMLRFRRHGIWDYLSREGGRKQDRGACTRAANHPPWAGGGGASDGVRAEGRVVFWMLWAQLVDWFRQEDEQGASKSASLTFLPGRELARRTSVKSEKKRDGLGVC